MMGSKKSAVIIFSGKVHNSIFTTLESALNVAQRKATTTPGLPLTNYNDTGSTPLVLRGKETKF